MILERKQKVSISIMGTDGNLSVIGSFQIIQDAITALTGILGIDGATIRDKYNALWVFTKTRTKFIKKIAWDTEITITSYISLISNAKIHVDVIIKDSDKNVALFSKTELCVLDITSQRIRKTSSVGVDGSMLANNKPPTDLSFTKFAEEKFQLVDKIQIKSSNIDFSHHTNNSEYIRFVMDTYSVEDTENKLIKEFEIIYSNQSFEKDILDIRKASFIDKDLILIEKNAQPIVKCEIIFDPSTL